MSKVIFIVSLQFCYFKFQTDKEMSALIRLTAITKQTIENNPTNYGH